MTVFIVFKYVSSSSNRYLLYGATTGTGRSMLFLVATTNLLNSSYPTSLSTGSSPSSSYAHIASLVMNTTTSEIYVDGTLGASGDIGTNNIEEIRVGATGSTTSGYNGDIGEIIIYSSALSTGNRQSVESYLRQKWVPSTPPATGYVAWYDAADSSTITESGGLVSQWDDKSGNGNNLIQSTGSWQPTTGSRTQNGLNVIDFDGSSDWMGSAVSSSTRTQSIFMVVLTDTTGSDRTPVGTSAAGGRQIQLRNTSGWRLALNKSDLANLASLGAVGASASTPYIWTALLSDTAIQLGQNGTYETDSDSTTFTGSLTTVVGAEQGSKQYWDGWIGEIIIYDSTLSDADRDSVVSYLNQKWGIY